MVREGVWCGVGMGEHFFGNPLRGIIQGDSNVQCKCAYAICGKSR
jgi:hypothetical protein